MQGVVAFFSETRRRLRSGGASGQPPAATTASSAYELREEHLGRLHRAAAHGDLAWLRRWRWWLKRVGIDKRDEQKRTPLHLACANGHADVVQYLVRKSCQLNLADSFERSPLMKAVECQQEKCVAILLEHGADPNLADADGNTALHLAVLSPNTTVAGLLLEHNANIDAQNQDGYTPLNLAVSRHQEEMVEFLQKKGADRCAQDQRESELLVENVDGENMEEPHAGGAEDKVVLSSSFPVRTVDKAALAQDARGGQPVGEVEQEHGAEFPEDFEACARLQQELADALKKQAVSEALLEVTKHYNRVSYEENLCLQKKLKTVKAEIRELEECQLQSEHCVRDLETLLDNKGREVAASSQKLQDLLLTSFGTNPAIKNMEEQVQRVEMECSRLDAMVQQQSSRTEALQRDLQASASVGDLSQQLEKESKKCMRLEAQNCDLQEQLSAMRESHEKLEKSKCQLEEEVAKLKRHMEANMVDHSQAEQYEREVEERAVQGRRRRLREVNLVPQVGELYDLLEKESKKCTQLEAQNRSLREEFSTVRENHEDLQKSKCRLEEEVASLKHHMDTNMVDRSQAERYKREAEERATQELRQKLEEVNLVLREEFSTVRESYEDLQKSKCRLEEEVASLKHHMDTNMVDRSEAERYKREAEERATQELRQKLEEVNLILQEEFSTVHERYEDLKKSKCRLEEEVASLKHHMDTNMVDRSQAERYKREAEERATQELRQKLEEVNLILREEFSTVRERYEDLQKSKCRLEEEVASLKHHMDTNMVDHSQAERYRREAEERAAQELRQKLEEVNLFLQTQAVSQDRSEQVRGSLYDMRYRLRDLQCEMANMQKNSHQESSFQQESLCAELERYKKLYLKEVDFRKHLGNELERANERLAEANAKLLQERRRKRLPFISSSASEDLFESPVQCSIEPGHLGNALSLNTSLCSKNQPKHRKGPSAIKKRGFSLYGKYGDSGGGSSDQASWSSAALPQGQGLLGHTNH